MRSFVQNTFHLVFTPKYRKPILELPGHARLHAYSKGWFEKKECKLFRMGGVEDHLHFAFFKHPSYAESDLVRDFKRSLHNFVDRSKLFPLFDKWQLRYSLFTYSYSARPALFSYIENQVEHHRDQGAEYVQELRALYDEHGLPFHEYVLE